MFHFINLFYFIRFSNHSFIHSYPLLSKFIFHLILIIFVIFFAFYSEFRLFYGTYDLFSLFKCSFLSFFFSLIHFILSWFFILLTLVLPCVYWPRPRHSFFTLWPWPRHLPILFIYLFFFYRYVQSYSYCKM